MGKSPVQTAVGRVAAASRKVNVAPGALEEARRELQVERLKRAIDREIKPRKPYQPLPAKDRRALANRLLGK